MGTRGWTLSTFLGCCIWILHGLGAAAAPVTTEGPFTVGTAFPITTENEGPSALVTGTAGTSTTAADAEIDESIFTRNPLSSIFPPRTELDSFVTATSEYGSTVPTLMNVTKPLNTSQGVEGGLAASTTATTAAAITAQHPAVTPEAEYEVIDATPDPTLDINPDVKEDIPAAVTRGEEDIDLTTGNMSYPTTPPPADTWVPQPPAGSPVGVSVTVLPSQGLTTAMGTVEEVVTLSASVQSGANANSLSPSPSTEELLTTQQGGVVSRVEATNPETAEEMAPAAEESPLASESGDAGDTTNGEFSTAGSSHLPPESPVMLETVGNPGEPSFLPGHAVLSPDASLAPSTGNGDGQGVSSEASGSALSPAASEAPVAPEETEDTATTLLAPEVPTYAQSDMNLPTVATVLPTGDVGAVGLDNPSLQPDPWQTSAREKPPLLPDALMDAPNAPGAAYPPPGAEANTLPAADGAAETLSSADLTTAPEAPMSPSLGESQPGGMPDGPPQESVGHDTGLSSDSDAPSPALFVPDGLAWPTAGVQSQGAQGAEDMAQVGGPGDGSPYTDTQSDTSLSDIQPSASPANNGELLAEGTGDLASAGQSPPPALGDGTGAGDAPALGEVSSPDSVPPSSAGMEPDLSGAEGPADLPSESASGLEAVYPLPGTVPGPASETETPASPDLSGAQGAPGSPSFGRLQPWGTATGAPQGAGLPGAEGPDSGLSLSGDAPSSAVHGLVGPPSPALGDQLGTNLGLPAAGGPGVGTAEGTAEQALEGAGSGIDSESSLSSTAGSGMAAGIDRLLGEGSSSGPASPSDVVAAASVSRGDEAGPISGAPLGPDSLSSASPDSETGPGLGLVEGVESAGDVAQTGNPESPYMETNPSAFNPQQDPANTRELSAGETGALVNTEQSPPPALGDGTGAGDAPELGEVSSPGSVPPSSAGMEPDLSGAEGPADLPSESASGLGAVYPLPGTVPGPASETETPASPDLSGAQGAPGSPSFGRLQPWGTATGAPQGAGLPGAEGPDSGLSLSGDAPSSAVHGLVGPPSPALGDQLGTNLGLPVAGGPGVGTAEGTAEQALEGAGSGIDSESSLSSTAGSGMAAGIDQLPGEGSSSGPASPSDVVAAASVSRGDEAGPISGAAPGPDSMSLASPASETRLMEGAKSAGDVTQAGNPESPYIETNPSAFSPQEDQLPSAGSSSGPAPPSGEVATSSVSDPASQSALGGEGNTPGALQPSLDAEPGIPAAAGEGASEMAGDGESMGQSQAPTGNGPAGSGIPDEDMGDVLQSVSSSSSTEGSSLPGRTDEAVNKASLPGADGADGGLNTGLEAAGPQEAPVSVPGIQSGANIGLSDGKQSQVNAVQVPGGASVKGGSSPGASLVPVAPDNSGVSDSTATSTAASLLLPEHGLSSGLVPNGDTHSAPSTQSGSRPLVPGAPSGLAGESGGISWSLEDELASGMPAPLGEASPHAPISPNSAPVLPSAPQRGNAAEGVSVSPELSAPLAALPAVPLYGYGARENDREYVERRVDFNSPLFKPETGFPFGRTLRDSLYFTDNGQIVFPASDKGIFTYPNPPPGGFNGHEEVPMIAVFWDNADFSRGVGTTFYQEFSTLNTAKPPFVRDVEAKVRRYMRSSYSAAWTLKITWEKAPVYASRSDTRKTITYQAILTTDGFRSYILMLYQDRGMQWDYTRLAATNVLIGYTSGDGFYYNDDLSKRPPAVKYRPDQFRGYNTDLRGLWIYKLESRVGINYRLKCLAWTGQQQEPRAWSQGLPTCPCSLQQGQQDPRFKSSRGGRWAARVSMLHSASPNQHGAGVRCLYDSQNQLIEGRQERYWRSSRQASPYRDQELKLYDWCCNRAGSAHLCARYSEKRPKIGCDGYQSPGIDSSEEIERDSDEETDGDNK
ncbi:mucin-4-like isoform X2 [Chiroxiphia lanceolata]|uniref:mucin-4-like isoform X2 n=1 Tax=Chiroxiphia lanceolata TaxID=296741 RepID=UPI0013CE5CE1|nr:mucin-4-like isoform X2 [Chiroxiphia lanceolata]